MVAIALGWKLIGISLLVLVVAAGIGAVTYEKSSPRIRSVRRVAGVVAIAALLTVLVIAIVGPGAWCDGGDPYATPGCA